jgi:hypothetical protein
VTRLHVLCGLALSAALQLACADADVTDVLPSAGDGSAAPEVSLGSACFDLPGTGAKADEAALVRKGLSMNGITAQGMSFQGMTYQGMNAQGLTPQGTSDIARGQELQRGEFRLSALNGVQLSLAGARLSLDRGVLVSPAPLLGATLDARTADGRTFPLRIERVENDGALTRYGLSAFDLPVCANAELGVFIPGAWGDSGEHLASEAALTYACESGVLHKCVAWGYAPWQLGEDFYQTCTRLARADYCGDGQSWTREHTPVNIYDGIGLQRSEPSEGLSFEAAWGPAGAVCVNESRYQVRDLDGTPLLPSCWADLPRCETLAEAGVGAAWIANDSEHTPIRACAR